jgi:alpha-galactosidase
LTRIAIIGAGSVSFTRTIVSDLLQQPATSDCDLRLYDIDAGALEAAALLVEQMRQDAGAPGPIRQATDLRDCVRQADYVICTLLAGGRAAAIKDFEVTGNYGLRYTVGDTLGVTGISRAMRTIPALLEIASACQDVAPGALLLNYTNPMGMVVSAIGREIGFPTVGLCHSAEFTAQSLAEYVGVPLPSLQWWSAGINHLAWMLSLAADGRDLYPDLAKAAERDEIYERDMVRFELMKRVGYFVTESSKHVAEYVPFFINKPAEVERLKVPVGEFLTRRPVPIAVQLERARGQSDSYLLPRSNEYAPALIAARESHTDWVFQGNIMNDGVIDNLSSRMCVEAPCVVSNGQVTPTRVGRLPTAAAGLTQQSLTVQELAVEAVTRRDKDLLCQAVMMDPQASATLTLDSIWQLVDDLLEAHPQTPEFTSRRLWQFDPVSA